MQRINIESLGCMRQLCTMYAGPSSPSSPMTDVFSKRRNCESGAGDVGCLCSLVVMPGQGTLRSAVAPEMSRSLSPTPAPDRVLLPHLMNTEGHGSRELQTAPPPQNSLAFRPFIQCTRYVSRGGVFCQYNWFGPALRQAEPQGTSSQASTNETKAA